MLISVIIPNYNHAKYLDQRIQSILNQTYQNFELIILDDNSPDEGASHRVIESYKDNPHVTHIVYNEVNSGSPFKQWDKGINLAEGTLIWIAESDDYCDTSLLEKLVYEFKNDPMLTLAYSLSCKVNQNGDKLPIISYKGHGVTRLKGSDYITRYMALDNHCKNASACLFKKEAYVRSNKQYTTYRAGGDVLFWIEIAEQGNVAIINKELNYFRQHQNKVTPNSIRKGINYYEAKKTYEYIFSRFYISNFRKLLMLKNIQYLMETSKFESNLIRNDLLDYWGVKPLRGYEKLCIRFIRALKNRFNLYI